MSHFYCNLLHFDCNLLYFDCNLLYFDCNLLHFNCTSTALLLQFLHNTALGASAKLGEEEGNAGVTKSRKPMGAFT